MKIWNCFDVRLKKSRFESYLYLALVVFPHYLILAIKVLFLIKQGWLWKLLGFLCPSEPWHTVAQNFYYCQTLLPPSVCPPIISYNFFNSYKLWNLNYTLYSFSFFLPLKVSVKSLGTILPVLLWMFIWFLEKSSSDWCSFKCRPKNNLGCSLKT